MTSKYGGVCLKKGGNSNLIVTRNSCCRNSNNNIFFQHNTIIRGNRCLGAVNPANIVGRSDLKWIEVGK